MEFWWQTHPLRIDHPNMKLEEAEKLNVKQFITECKDLHAEAIVFSTKAIYAFYNTWIIVHQRRPLNGTRVLLAEVIKEGESKQIKVIARVEFSNAERRFIDNCVEWFHLNQGEKPIPSPDDPSNRFYETNLMGGYQNQDYAIPVLDELINNYNLHGIHLNAGGWRSSRFDKSMVLEYHFPENKIGCSCSNPDEFC